MATALFFNIPAFGHINPTLPVVSELIDQGCTVVYYNVNAFKTEITKAGADFCAYPETGLSVNEFSSRIDNLSSVTVLLLEQCFQLLPFALEEIDKRQPDVVVFDALALWGMQAARLSNIPSVASIGLLVQEGSAGLLNWRDYISMLRQGLPSIPAIIRRQLNSQYGASVFPNKALLPATGDQTIVYTSRAFQPKTPFINDSFHFVGPSILPSTRLESDFPWEQLETGRRKIYLSFGTLYNDNLAFYQSVLREFADYPGQIVISVGKQIEIAELGTLPQNAIVQPTVPQLDLLRWVDLFITHGGMNSISEALYYGVPLVVVPQQLEQAINGRQVAHHNAGVVLADRPPYGQLGTRILRRTAEQVMADPAYRASAKSLGETLRSAGGHKRAAQIIRQACQ